MESSLGLHAQGQQDSLGPGMVQASGLHEQRSQKPVSGVESTGVAISWTGVCGDEGCTEWTDQRWGAQSEEMSPGKQQTQLAQSQTLYPNTDHMCLWPPDRAVTWHH